MLESLSLAQEGEGLAKLVSILDRLDNWLQSPWKTEKACYFLPHGNHSKLISSPIIYLKRIIPLDIQIISLTDLYQDQLLIYLLITNAQLYNKSLFSHHFSSYILTNCKSLSNSSLFITKSTRPERQSSTVNWCLVLCMTYWHEGQMLCNGSFVASSVGNL